MRYENNRGKRAKPTPEERYRDFAKDNVAWDRKVKESLDRIEQAARQKSNKRHAAPS